MVFLRFAIAEIMALINDYHAVVIVAKIVVESLSIGFFLCLVRFINELTKATGCDEAYAVSYFVNSILVKILNGLYPGLLDCRRGNNKNLPVPVKSRRFGKELLDYQKSDNSFPKAHDIAQNKAAMLTHDVETLLDCVHLVRQRRVIDWQV